MPDSARRSLSFNVGQGTQDIGFRNDIEWCSRRCRRIAVRLARRRRTRRADDRRRSWSRTIADRIYPNDLEAAGAGLLLSAAGVSARRPDDRAAVRIVQADGVARARVRAADATLRARRARTRWLFRLVRWIDPSRVRLVFRRSSHPFRRLLALREPDRRRDARGHVAADRRRGAERRVGADLGTVVLLSEAVLQRRGSSAVETRIAPDALRPRDLRLSRRAMPVISCCSG